LIFKIWAQKSDLQKLIFDAIFFQKDFWRTNFGVEKLGLKNYGVKKCDLKNFGAKIGSPKKSASKELF